MPAERPFVRVTFIGHYQKEEIDVKGISSRAKQFIMPFDIQEKPEAQFQPESPNLIGVSADMLLRPDFSSPWLH